MSSSWRRGRTFSGSLMLVGLFSMVAAIPAQGAIGTVGSVRPNEARINLELSQPVLTKARAFDFLFQDDQRPNARGGTLPGSNPFVGGGGRAANRISFDSSLGVTTLRLAGDSTVPLSDLATKFHAGYVFRGEYREVLALHWVGTDGSLISVPDVTCVFSFDPGANEVTVVAENHSSDVVKISGAGYLTRRRFPSLEELNSTNFPASRFTPASILNVELLPGQGTSALVVPLDAFHVLVTRARITFSGSSVGQPYSQAGGDNLSLWSFRPEGGV